MKKWISIFAIACLGCMAVSCAENKDREYQKREDMSGRGQMERGGRCCSECKCPRNGANCKCPYKQSN